MTLTYDEIYEDFYLIVDDDFFKIEEKMAYSLMKKWIRSAFTEPYIRELFSSVTVDDDVEEVECELKNNYGNYDSDSFVKNILTLYMKIAWQTPQIDSAVNRAKMIGGKDEKKLLDPYKNNIERLKELKDELKKTIKDYNSNNNDYIGGVT